MRRAFLGLALCTLAVLALTGRPALAHTVSAHAAAHAPVAAAPVPLTEVITATDAPRTPWAALAVLAAVGMAAVSGRRRAVAVTLALVVVVLAFETGVHSTHHLGRTDESARCPIAGVLTQLSADVVDVGAVAPPAAPAQTSVVGVTVQPVADRAVAPHLGRAPPVLSA